jgi:hypothetical protein
MKYRFKVIYATKSIKEASRLMRQLDLDMGEIGIEQTIEFTSKNDLEINLLKEKLRLSFESCEYELMHIEGGKIE